MPALLRACAAAVLFVWAAAPAQEQPHGQTSLFGGGGCPEPPTFYDGKYNVRRVRLVHPFPFLAHTSSTLQSATPALESEFENKPLSVKAALAAFDRLKPKLRPPDPINLRVAADFSSLTLENCEGNELDLVYRFYSTRISPFLGLGFESRKEEPAAPQNTAGHADARQPLRVLPRLEYDRTENLSGGVAASVRLPNSIFERFDFEVLQSTRATDLRGAFEGSLEPESGRFSRLSWSAGYAYGSAPIEAQRLRQGALEAHFLAATRPRNSAVLRFGAAVEGGNAQSTYESGLASSANGSLKLFLGTTFRRHRQAFAMSYGLQLGVTGLHLKPDYHKHVGDVGWDVWFPTGLHREISIENRFTAGALSGFENAPVQERFLGGNVSRPFVPGASWDFRANPVLRSFPANRLVRTTAGIGAERFYSYNLTLSFTGKHRPMVPREVVEDRCFNKGMESVLDSAESFLRNGHRADDAAAKRAASLLPDAAGAARDLAERFLAVSGKLAEESEEDAVEACQNNLTIAQLTFADGAKSRSPSVRYSQVASLLAKPAPDTGGERIEDPECVMRQDGETDEDEASDEIDVSLHGISACVNRFNAKWRDAGIDAALAKLAGVADRMRKELTGIDEKRVAFQTGEDMTSIRRVTNTLLRELNVFSIDPVVVFDAARIGPRADLTNGGHRFALGGGVRFSLVSAVRFTVGYAANLNRRMGEPYGALFGSLTFRDLFF